VKVKLNRAGERWNRAGDREEESTITEENRAGDRGKSSQSTTDRSTSHGRQREAEGHWAGPGDRGKRSCAVATTKLASPLRLPFRFPLPQPPLQLFSSLSCVSAPPFRVWGAPLWCVPMLLPRSPATASYYLEYVSKFPSLLSYDA
jgi:hypothetical protein